MMLHRIHVGLELGRWVCKLSFNGFIVINVLVLHIVCGLFLLDLGTTAARGALGSSAACILLDLGGSFNGACGCLLGNSVGRGAGTVNRGRDAELAFDLTKANLCRQQH